MALDDLQRQTRQRYLGSSDAAAIAGRDPWRTAADVWAEKTSRVPPSETSPAMEVGHYLEAGLLDWTCAALGVPALARDRSLVHPNEVLAANLDALLLAAEPRAIVEAKTSGILGLGTHLDEWGEAGTDEVPEHVLLQIHHQFAVVGAQPELADIRLCYVPALLARRGLVLFRIERSDALVAALVARELDFWSDYVARDRCPPESLPSLDTLKRLRREPETIAELEPDIVAGWREAKEALRLAGEREAAARRVLLAALGDAEGGRCALGTVTYLERTRAGYTVEPTTYRELRFKEPARARGKERAA